MKKLTTLVCIAFVNLSFGQTLDEVLTESLESKSIFQASSSSGELENGVFVMELPSGELVTQGDSKEVIKMLWNSLKKERADSAEKDRVILSSVQWTNTVSDYFRKNKQWSRYAKDLKTQGYVINKKQ